MQKNPTIFPIQSGVKSEKEATLNLTKLSYEMI